MYYYTSGRPDGEASRQAHTTLYQGAPELCPGGPTDARCYPAGVRRVPAPRDNTKTRKWM